MTTPKKERPEHRSPVQHEHRDVSGGWLRPAVFGAMDGLVTNVSLIAGVGGGGGSQHTILLTGLAGLAAGAFSMAAGEFVSVSSQNELVAAEVDKERHELASNAAAEQVELVGMLRARGISATTARQAAEEISAHPDKALAMHAFEELGVNPSELPSPFVAAGASLVAFAAGAIVPLLPYALGSDTLWIALVLSALAAVVGGGMVARLTARPFWRGAVRQLVLGALAAGFTYLIGLFVGGVVLPPPVAPAGGGAQGRPLPTGKVRCGLCTPSAAHCAAVLSQQTALRRARRLRAAPEQGTRCARAPR